MDAPVFSACPHAEPATPALSGAESSRAFDAAAAPVQRGTRGQARTDRQQVYFCARRVAGGCGSAVTFGPRRDLRAFCGSGAQRHSAEPRGGAQHWLYLDASRTPSEEHADILGHAARNSGLRLSGSGSALDAAAGAVDGSAAGIWIDRFAGGARFLSSLHRRRTFVAHHRTFAGIGGAT